jgi:hypothetical protein
MKSYLFDKLFEDGLIDEESLHKIKTENEQRPFSLHWELKILLYAGILMFSAGVGMFIYENINTIGHLTIILLLALLSVAGFIYAFRQINGFSRQKLESPGMAYDYAVLLSAMLMVSCIGYLQFQYHFFGSDWNLASLVPALLLMFCAYYYDHLGVLSLAITNFAAFIGIALSPMHFFEWNNLNNYSTIVAMFLFALVLLAMSFLSVTQNTKAHFSFTYKNFGFHLLFISLIAALVKFQEIYLLLFGVFAVAAVIQFRQAAKERSSYFMVFNVIYSYIAMSYTFLKLLFSAERGGDIGLAYFAILFHMATAVFAIVFLINTLKKTRHENSL